MIPWCYKDVSVNSFFPRTARLWNSLPAECFPFTYDLYSFKSRVNSFSLGLSNYLSFIHSLFFSSFSYKSIPHSGCSFLLIFLISFLKKRLALWRFSMCSLKGVIQVRTHKNCQSQNPSPLAHNRTDLAWPLFMLTYFLYIHLPPPSPAPPNKHLIQIQFLVTHNFKAIFIFTCLWG